MATAKSEEHVTLKLFSIKEGNKVLFAESENDFVDILFSFLTLPLGTIARLERKESNVPPTGVASLSSLYQSVKDLENEYLCADKCKRMLLRPTNAMEANCKNVKLNIDDTGPTKYFVCQNIGHCRINYPVLLSTFNTCRCRCGKMLSRSVSLESSDVNDGFVRKCNASFFITDDLKVVPNSLDMFLSLFKNSGIEGMSSVKEVTVTLTKNQVLDLLKKCLHSKTCLTDFFLKKPSLETLFKRIKFPRCDFNANGGRKIMVKIMQRKSNGKIAFAQGKEDFANFLFSFLTIPLGGVAQLMQGGSSVGSIDGLYKSVIDLEEHFWTRKELKNKLVNPVLAPQYKFSKMLLPVHYDVPKYFCCTEPNEHGFLGACYLTSTHRHFDASLGHCAALVLVDSLPERGVFSNSEGYAKGPTLFMATDDLVVKSISSACVISLLNSMSIPVNDLEEKEVCIGVEEGVRILQASLISKSALTIGLSHLFTKVKEEN